MTQLRVSLDQITIRSPTTTTTTNKGPSLAELNALEQQAYNHINETSQVSPATMHDDFYILSPITMPTEQPSTAEYSVNAAFRPWTEKEHNLFVEALQIFASPLNTSAIASFVQTRTASEVEAHYLIFKKHTPPNNSVVGSWLRTSSQSPSISPATTPTVTTPTITTPTISTPTTSTPPSPYSDLKQRRAPELRTSQELFELVSMLNTTKLETHSPSPETLEGSRSGEDSEPSSKGSRSPRGNRLRSSRGVSPKSSKHRRSNSVPHTAPYISRRRSASPPIIVSPTSTNTVFTNPVEAASAQVQMRRPFSRRYSCPDIPQQQYLQSPTVIIPSFSDVIIQKRDHESIAILLVKNNDNTLREIEKQIVHLNLIDSFTLMEQFCIDVRQACFHSSAMCEAGSAELLPPMPALLNPYLPVPESSVPESGSDLNPTVITPYTPQMSISPEPVQQNAPIKQPPPPPLSISASMTASSDEIFHSSPTMFSSEIPDSLVLESVAPQDGNPLLGLSSMGASDNFLDLSF